MKAANKNSLKKRPRNNARMIPITLDEALPDGLVDPVNYGGLIFREKADGTELIVGIPTSTWIPIPTVPGREDLLQLYLNLNGDFETGFFKSESVLFVGAVPTHYDVTIPRRLLAEGKHFFSYVITVASVPGNEAGSEPAELIIDRTAPYGSHSYVPRPLTLPAGWPGSITEAFMALHDAAGGIPFGIPDYVLEGADVGDRYRLYYSGSNEPIAEGPVFPDEVVRYSRALAEAADGPRKLEYRLVDVAGNVSDASFELPISVALRPAPTLAAAGVRDALSLNGLGDRLIDRPDTARSFGMFVIIPAYVADRSADEFIVHLNTTHGPRDVGPIALGGAPLPFDFHVGYEHLVALYASIIGPIGLEVSYSVRRHGVLHRVPTVTNINLDLSKGGPNYPEEPESPNSNLLAPVLTGAGSGKTNELDESDNGLDALVEVELWSEVPLPSDRDFTLHLMYMNDLVDSQPVSAATAMPGDKIAMRVPWPFIRRHANEMIPLFYQISIAGTNNRSSSPTQLINVNANIIAFLKPSVLGALPAVPGPPPLPGLITCGALLLPARNARVAVPPNPLLETGMIITVNWTGCSDDEGTAPIAGATGTFPYGPITFAEAQLGFTVQVGPYDTYIKPINTDDHSMGSVVISYTVPIAGPSPVTSAEEILQVRGVVSGPAYCDGMRWP